MIEQLRLPPMSTQYPLKRLASSPYVTLSLGIIFLSISPLFTHWADAPGVVTSFYRMVIAVMVLTPFITHIFPTQTTQGSPQFTWHQVCVPVLAGVFSGIDHSLWGTALKETSVANATLLNYISPLWVSLVAIVVFKERYKAYYWVGLALVLVGSISVLNILNTNLTFNVRGEGFAVLSSFFYAGYFLLTQKGRTFFSTLQQLYISLAACALTIGVILVIFQVPIIGFSRSTYLIFLLAALFSQLLGYFSLTHALGKIPASIVSPSLTLQPVITAVLAIPFANQSLANHQIIGGLLVLVGIITINTSEIRT
jgi:drug/metabolite transporter (DMT)-like permease